MLPIVEFYEYSHFEFGKIHQISLLRKLEKWITPSCHSFPCNEIGISVAKT